MGNSPINDLMLAWYDHFLKGVDNNVTGADDAAAKPRVDYFVMGSNTWKTTTNWPVPQTQWINYYLSGAGGIADRAGALLPVLPGPQAPDTYTYDPLDPAPSLGGHSCCEATTGPQGPYDQMPVQQRSDVLVYTGDPVPETPNSPGRPRSACGRNPPRWHRFHRQARVVKPDGSSINLNNGIIRAASGFAVGADADRAGATV